MVLSKHIRMGQFHASSGFKDLDEFLFFERQSFTWIADANFRIGSWENSFELVLFFWVLYTRSSLVSCTRPLVVLPYHRCVDFCSLVLILSCYVHAGFPFFPSERLFWWCLLMLPRTRLFYSLLSLSDYHAEFCFTGRARLAQDRSMILFMLVPVIWMVCSDVGFELSIEKPFFFLKSARSTNTSSTS